MKTVEYCLTCTIQQDQVFFNKFLPELSLEGRREHYEWIASMFNVGMPTVELGVLQNERCQLLLEKAGKDRDAFREIRDKSHRIAKKLTKYKPKTLDEKIMYAIAGNRIDYGREEYPNGEFLIEEIQRIVSEKSLKINDISKFHEALKKAKSIMYLLDNAGEDLFDLPLIEHCTERVGKDGMFIVARSQPIVNDVTVDELYENDFEKYGQILPVGGFQHGVMMNRASDEFKKVFENVDLIIAKCGPVADSLGLEKGSNIVLSSNRYAKDCKRICLHDTSECVHRTKIYIDHNIKNKFFYIDF